MSKPWDNELTPMVNKFFGLTKREQHNLERRLRHAERLLEDVLGDATIFYEEKTLSKIATHLEAARQEDGQKELI